jgi:hypothetical protein
VDTRAPDAAVEAAAVAAPHVDATDLIAILDAIWPVALEVAREPDGAS